MQIPKGGTRSGIRFPNSSIGRVRTLQQQLPWRIHSLLGMAFRQPIIPRPLNPCLPLSTTATIQRTQTTLLCTTTHPLTAMRVVSLLPIQIILPIRLHSPIRWIQACIQWTIHVVKKAMLIRHLWWIPRQIRCRIRIIETQLVWNLHRFHRILSHPMLPPISNLPSNTRVLLLLHPLQSREFHRSLPLQTILRSNCNIICHPHSKERRWCVVQVKFEGKTRRLMSRWCLHKWLGHVIMKQSAKTAKHRSDLCFDRVWWRKRRSWKRG